MYGKTLCYKTILARSLGKHSYFNGMFNLNDFDAQCAYAVFDDIGGGLLGMGSHSLAYKQWLGGQHQFTTTDKYKKKRTIIWGRPTIYIAQTNPLLERGVDVDWLAGNCILVEIKQDMISIAAE